MMGIFKLFKRKEKYPKKTTNLCDKCYYRVFGPHCVDCGECDNRTDRGPGLSRCNCCNVTYGSPCKYFKEAEDK